MSDFLTHLFLPLTVVYIVWPERFRSPIHLSFGAFGLLADFDKFLGQPGLLHSLLTLVPIAAMLVLIELRLQGELELAPVAIVLIFSHLLLDFLDGGPVPLLYPIFEQGVGLRYPARTAFGSGLVGVAIEGPLVALRTTIPKSGFNTYGFITGYGVANLILFLIVYVDIHMKSIRSAH